MPDRDTPESAGSAAVDSTSGAPGAVSAATAFAAGENPAASSAAALQPLPPGSEGLFTPQGNTNAASLDENTRIVRQLIDEWKAGKLPDNATGQALAAALDIISENLPGAGDPVERYAPLAPRSGTNGQQACWDGAYNTGSGVRGIVFWLDVLSTGDTISFMDVDEKIRPAVLEAALNPRRIQECGEADGVTLASVYLDEVRFNPGFVNFIVRDVPAYNLDVTGASLVSSRFVQTRNGEKLKLGAAPDRNSRIAGIGELGLAISQSNGLATVIFGPDISWVMQ